MTDVESLLRPRRTGILGVPGRIFQVLRRWPIIPLIVLASMIFMAVFANQIAPEDPIKQSLRDRNAPPAWFADGTTDHLLGADHVGRDVLSRMIHGARISLLVAAVSLVSGLVVGTTLGLIAGWYGGIIDEAISRFLDIFYGMPFLLLALVVVIVLGQSVQTIMAVLALSAWTGFVRNVRVEVLTLKTRDYVALAQVAGASTLHIMSRHIFPGVVNTVIVIATLNSAGLILTEATLSFLGAGIPSPTPAWGLMIAEGRDYLTTAWWISFFPGLAIFLVAMSLNFLGDWMRDRFDPRLRQLD